MTQKTPCLLLFLFSLYFCSLIGLKQDCPLQGPSPELPAPEESSPFVMIHLHLQRCFSLGAGFLAPSGATGLCAGQSPARPRNMNMLGDTHPGFESQPWSEVSPSWRDQWGRVFTKAPSSSSSDFVSRPHPDFLFSASHHLHQPTPLLSVQKDRALMLCFGFQSHPPHHPTRAVIPTCLS